jgi:hypothetical protein
MSHVMRRIPEIHACMEWMRSNELEVLAVLGEVASCAQSFNAPDDRFAMSRLACLRLEEAFSDSIKRKESKGYDLVWGLGVKVSLKMLQTIFGGEQWRRNKRRTGPKIITMANTRSPQAAENVDPGDFDILFAYQRGPLESGRRKSRFITQFGLKQHDKRLCDCYTTGVNDPQRKLRLERDNWDYLSSELEIVPYPAASIDSIMRRPADSALLNGLASLKAARERKEI